MRPVERGIYRLTGIDEEHEQGWKSYLVAMLLVSVIGLVFTYVILRIQNDLPLNPEGFPGVPPALAFNTAVSFTTNTNWQNYTGEATMSYLSQMLALTFHQFLSAATGIALAIAVIRGVARHSARTIGNFYVDIVRCFLYVLIPIAVVGTIILVASGAIQNLSAYTPVNTLEGVGQTISQGPVAAMEAIKDLGTNGGGFFNANSAAPFENPTGLTNALEIFLCLVLPFGLAFTFGKWVGNIKQGLALFAAMAIILVGGAIFAAQQEQAGNPALSSTAVSQVASNTQSGGNLEGKEVRFGSIQSAQYNTATTGTSTGSVDAAQDSFTPLGGMVPMVLIELGEITPGGTGSGLYGMIAFAIVAVFLAGLMVGRTPEYLGKKIEVPRHQVRGPRHPHPALLDPGVHGTGRAHPGGPGGPAQRGSSRLQRDPLRLQLDDRQQRQRLRRAQREHALLQHHPGGGDVAGPDHLRDPGAGPGWVAGQEEDRPRRRRYLPHRHPALHRPPRRHHPHRRCPDLLPGAVSRAHPRAAPAPRRHPPSLGALTS